MVAMTDSWRGESMAVQRGAGRESIPVEMKAALKALM